VFFASAWNDLAAWDVGVSFKSERRLAAPAATVNLFADKTQRVDALVPKRTTAEQLRQIRAVTVLEQIGDRASKILLKRWTGDPAGALLTEDASAALMRPLGMVNVKQYHKSKARSAVRWLHERQASRPGSMLADDVSIGITRCDDLGSSQRLVELAIF
jgi:hypothetical protein